MSRKNIDKIFLKAVNDGNLDMVMQLIIDGADVNIENEDGMTALHLATIKGDSEMVKILIRNDARISKQDRYGKTPLHYAIEKGDIEIVRILVASDNKIAEIEDNRGLTPLHYAILGNKIEIAKILFFIAPKAIKEKNAMDESPVYIASKEHRTIATKFFTIIAPDIVKQKNIHNASILQINFFYWAPAPENIKIPLILITNGIPVNTKNIIGGTTLEEASISENDIAIKLIFATIMIKFKVYLDELNEKNIKNHRKRTHKLYIF